MKIKNIWVATTQFVTFFSGFLDFFISICPANLVYFATSQIDMKRSKRANFDHLVIHNYFSIRPRWLYGPFLSGYKKGMEMSGFFYQDIRSSHDMFF